MVQKWPHAFGCDVAGTVEAAGKEASGIKAGDTVFGFTDPGQPDTGAFAELCKLPADMLAKVPAGISVDEAASMPIGYLTARLMLHETVDGAEPDVPVLIYGASSSVGVHATQLAKAGGRKVVAIASTKNHKMLEKLGAHTCADYKVEGWEAAAAEALGGNGSQPVALDTMGLPETTSACARILRACGGHKPGTARIATTNPSAEEEAGVTVVGVKLGGAYHTEERLLVASFMREVGELLSSDTLKPGPIEVIGGLCAVNGGLQRLRDGKVSGHKLVVHVMG